MRKVCIVPAAERSLQSPPPGHCNFHLSTEGFHARRTGPLGGGDPRLRPPLSYHRPHEDALVRRLVHPGPAGLPRRRRGGHHHPGMARAPRGEEEARFPAEGVGPLQFRHRRQQSRARSSDPLGVRCIPLAPRTWFADGFIMDRIPSDQPPTSQIPVPPRL